MSYQTIKQMVLPFLESHKGDLLIHDKKELKNYNGDFLYAFRTCGTNLFKLDLEGYNLEKDLNTQLENSKTFFIGNNKWFIYRKDGVIRHITIDEVNKIFDAYRNEVLVPFEKRLKKLNIQSIATCLYYFIQSKKRQWKSKLKELWSDGGAIDDLQRLRNHFDFKVLNQIKANSPESQIRELLYKNIQIA